MSSDAHGMPPSSPGSDTPTPNSTRKKGKRTEPKRSDGRRNNKTPQSGRIKPGEVRNPHGPRGKPKPEPLPSADAASRFDELFIAMASRTVSRDSQGPIDALKRLILAEWLDALGGDTKARARVLARAEPVFAREAAARNECINWFWTSKAHYTTLFEKARRARQLPPDVAHPDHVIIEGDKVTIVGPIERERRKHWEVLKSAIQGAAVFHDHARKRFSWDPSPENQAELKRIEKYRRRLRRAVPKGWDWKERIYTRYFDQKSADELISSVKEKFDAECEARDRISAD